MESLFFSLTMISDECQTDHVFTVHSTVRSKGKIILLDYFTCPWETRFA